MSSEWHQNEFEKLRTQRDGWRAVAIRLLQGDFGDTPPVEFIPERFALAFDADDRAAELVDELKRRGPLVTDVELSAAGDPKDPVTHIAATLGASARIVISRRPSVTAAFRFAVYHYSQTNEATLVASREISFDLLLRYVDMIIAGYRAHEYDGASLVGEDAVPL